MNNYGTAINMAQNWLRGEQNITIDLIRERVRMVLDLLEKTGQSEGIDEEVLVRELESRFNTWMGVGTVLEGVGQDHLPWLPDCMSEIKWKFWKRYERFLEEEKGLSPNVTRRLGQVTDTVLGLLENPKRQGKWDRRGMVVGHVQSGKTSNYIGLICKAADAGYKLIIVLAGIHNSLRSQTQLRIDEGFLGRDTTKNLAFDPRSKRMGVGLLPQEEFLVAQTLTTSADNGDFNRKVAVNAGIIPGGEEPLILIVKKNKSVLENLLKWALSVRGGKDSHTGRQIVRDVPLLVIDDEADNASVNTNPTPLGEDGQPLDDWDVSAINGLIRKLLDAFEKSAYVGYTATPFANIFIYPEGETDEYGRDLFPESFIINLDPPDNYVGPARVFGLGESGNGRESKGMPIVRPVFDYDTWLPNGHKKDAVPCGCADSLKKAIQTFVLVCAARLVRGQTSVHNSMLVHVTRFTAVQKRVTEIVTEYLDYLKKVIEYGPGKMGHSLMTEMEEIWHSDFVPTSREMGTVDGDIPEWAMIKERLHQAASRIQVKTINGSAKDVLDYWTHENGMNVIAIGGDKLSRGLTLEGLSVSYYLRASKMYDTLMQMGRWFGYRPGYMDLCRLFTSQELIDWYKFITMANEELRAEFIHMEAVGATPKDYGLRVRTHPDGLLITAVNKMKNGTIMQVSFSNSLSETVVFSKYDSKNTRNLSALEEFLAKLGPRSEMKSDNFVWQKVSADKVCEFLGEYESHPASRKSNTDRLTDYIKSREKDGELVEWTVALISNKRGKNMARIGTMEIGLTERSDDTRDSAENYTMPKRHLISPKDETIDLSSDEFDEALKRTNEERKLKRKAYVKLPSGENLREIRSATNGLLLVYPLDPDTIGSKVPVVGFAVSFPKSNITTAVEYKVNNVYWKQEFGGE